MNVPSIAYCETHEASFATYSFHNYFQTCICVLRSCSSFHSRNVCSPVATYDLLLFNCIGKPTTVHGTASMSRPKPRSVNGFLLNFFFAVCASISFVACMPACFYIWASSCLSAFQALRRFVVVEFVIIWPLTHAKYACNCGPWRSLTRTGQTCASLSSLFSRSQCQIVYRSHAALNVSVLVSNAIQYC